MKKKLVAIISFIILILVMMLIIVIFNDKNILIKDDKIEIVATLFPHYDFAKHIAGDKANVTLLISAGIEPHNYEPTVKDVMLMINYADMFLSCGDELEPWSKSLSVNLDNTKCKIVDLSKNIDLIKIEEFEEKYINNDISYGQNDENEHSHEEIYDGHIWLSPNNAIIMINNILESLIEIDPDNKDYYTQNAISYIDEIKKLDEKIKNVINNSARKEIAFGGEFAYAYLINDYDINFVSVYTNCGEGEDPSIKKVKSVIDYINDNNMPVVYYEELSQGTVAKMIAEETEAKAMVLYSLHNGNPENDTYVSLMEENIKNLEEGLK